MNETDVKHNGATVVIDICPACRGVWFDRGELGLLTHPRIEAELQTLHSGKDSITICPRCRTCLVISKIESVHADVCTRCCGIWLNRAEYLSIIRMATGGKEEEIVPGGALEMISLSLPPGCDILASLEDECSRRGLRGATVLAGCGPVSEAEVAAEGTATRIPIASGTLIALQGRLVAHHERMRPELYAVIVDAQGTVRAGPLARARARGNLDVTVAGVVERRLLEAH